MKLFPDPQALDEIVKAMSKWVPPGLEGVKAEMESNVKAVLQAAFARMDLVTKQEFDVQAGVLAKTREMLEALEKRLAELEKNHP